MNALARIALEMRVAEMSSGDRAYHHLQDAVHNGTEIAMTDHELVLATSKALWQRELATAQLGLSELETRIALSEREAA